MSYFVRKSNRCKNCVGDSVPVQYLSPATSSSMRSFSLVQTTLQKSELGVKRGSGGNSYSGYLRRRLGVARCCP